MKKAIISTILLGFVLISGLLVFVATVSDDMVVKNKVTRIKEITDNTALALAKHYVINEDTDGAQTVANALLDEIPLGLQIKDALVYTWDFVNDPNGVIVTLPTYNQETFWYKFLGKNSFTLENIESKAEIIVQNPISDTSESLAPLAINNCNRTDLVLDAQIDFTFTTAPYFDNTHTDTFYAVDKDCSFPTGNSTFAHFKGLFSNGEIEYTTYDESDNETACLVSTSFQNPLTVDPMQLYNQLSHFTLPYQMDILMFECGTTANDLIVTNVISVEIETLPPLSSGTTSDGQTTNELTISTKIVSTDTNVILKY